MGESGLLKGVSPCPPSVILNRGTGVGRGTGADDLTRGAAPHPS
jgi:hypothetical protein